MQCFYHKCREANQSRMSYKKRITYLLPTHFFISELTSQMPTQIFISWKINFTDKGTDAMNSSSVQRSKSVKETLPVDRTTYDLLHRKTARSKIFSFQSALSDFDCYSYLKLLIHNNIPTSSDDDVINTKTIGKQYLNIA